MLFEIVAIFWQEFE